jgi:Zn-dependent protease with chaperone function
MNGALRIIINIIDMEEKAKLVESLLEKATDYSKTSFELIKLKALDKTSDVISSSIPHSVVFFLIASCLLFVNLGLAFWIGEILGNTFFGFFVVAGFYGVAGLIIHFFMHKWLKKRIYNYFVKQLLK